MKKRSFFHTVRVMFPMAFHAAPLRFILINVLGISQSVVMGANTLLLSNFVNELIASVGKGRFEAALIAATAFYVCGIIGYQLLNTLFNYALTEFLEVCDETYRYEFNEKISKLFPLAFEQSESLDEIQKAQAGRDDANVFMFHMIGIIDMVPPYLVFFAIYAASLNPVLLLCIVISFVPSIVTLYMQRNIFYSYEDTAAPVRRKYQGYRKCLTDLAFIKETRVLRAVPFFFGKMKAEQQQLCEKEAAVRTKANGLDAINQTVGMLGYLGAVLILVVSVLRGSISVGAFAAVYYALNSLFDMVFALVCGFLGSAVGSLPAVENYVAFLEKDPGRSWKDVPRMGKAMRFSDVSFTYPSAKAPSIEHLNLTIPEKEHLAIVGENGAGKSTLAKLILGLYPPTEGAVTVDSVGTQLRGAEPKSAECTAETDGAKPARASDADSQPDDRKTVRAQRACVSPAETAIAQDGCIGRSAVFQNYMRYQMTLQDNVTISDPKKNAPVKPMLERTGLKPEAVAQCSELMLSREFEGIDLSGGLWQQVAIARGQYREHDLIVLDEPTAAIDPVEESAVYEKFLQMVKGKTAVIVTHRLASARLADRILVMEKGRIAEAGTHEELLAAGGLYSRMWKAQAESYQG